MHPLPYLPTERCILRLKTPDEAGMLCAFRHENAVHLAPWEPRFSAESFSEQYWQTQIESAIVGFNAGVNCKLGIFLQASGEYIGFIHFNSIIRNAFHSCFTGYGLAASMQGKGFMTEALAEAVHYMFSVQNLHRIAANYMPRNLASGRVLEKCGFVQEGRAEEYLRINGVWEEHILTARINPHWQEKISL